MAGTQGSSYSSSTKAAAANKTVTANLAANKNASGSVRTVTSSHRLLSMLPLPLPLQRPHFPPRVPPAKPWGQHLGHSVVALA